MGGRHYTSTNYWQPNDSNTICDITGFKVKRSGVLKRWEGFFVIPAAYHPRQPQDFPVTATKQIVYDDVRVEQVEAEGAVPFPEIV